MTNWKYLGTLAKADIEEKVRPDVLDNCFDFLEEEDWEGLADTMGEDLAAPYLDYLFPAFYALVPDEEKYCFAIQIYTKYGDAYDIVRKAIKELPCTRFPPRKFGKMVHVYRAENQSIEKAAQHISWTVDRETAEKFVVMQSMRYDTPSALYEGWIPKKKIIAYNNSIGESEIIQHNSVTNIREIPVSEKIVADMLGFGLGVRPCWPKCEPSKIELSGHDKDILEAVAPSDNLKAAQALVGKEFQFKNQEGKDFLYCDLGMDWHAEIYEQPNGNFLLHVGHGYFHKFGSFIDLQFLKTEADWVRRHYKHRKVKLTTTN